MGEPSIQGIGWAAKQDPLIPGVAPFGVANFNCQNQRCVVAGSFAAHELCKWTIEIPLSENVAGESKPISFSAKGVLQLTDWSNELYSIASNPSPSRGLYKSGEFEAVLYNSFNKIPIGRVFYFAEICLMNTPNFVAKPEPEPNGKLAIKSMKLLANSNAINIAKHIHNIFKDISIALEPEPRAKLEKALGLREHDSEHPPDAAQEDTAPPNAAQEDTAHPDAFFTISDLLVLKSENPIATACDYVALAKKNAEMARDNNKFLKARQWDELTEQCEQRVLKLLDITAELVPQDYGDIGTVWMQKLLWKIPELTSDIESPTVASHGINIDQLYNRWKTKYTNRFWGTSCCCPRKNPSTFETFGLCNSPSSVFLWNLLAYLLFLILATAVATAVDTDQYDSRAAMWNSLNIDSYQAISDPDSFWQWAQDTLGDTLFSQSSTANPELVGNLTLRQFRVSGSPCPQEPNRTCYFDLTRDQNNWVSGDEWKGTQWDPFASDTRLVSRVSNLPSGGYAISIPANQSAIQQILSDLQENGWIDAQTRVINLEFILYNPNLGFYGISMMTIEWNAAGLVAPTNNLYLVPVSSLSDNAVSVVHILVLLITLGYLAQEVYEFLAEEGSRIEYLLDILNWIDFVIFAVFFGLSLWRFFLVFPVDSPQNVDYNSLYNFWVIYTTQAVLEGILLTALWFRLSYFFRVSQYAGSILIITSGMLSDIVYFVTLLVIAISGVAILLDITLRSQVDSYMNLGATLQTLGFAAVGEGPGFQDAPGGGWDIPIKLGNTFFFFFCIIVVLVLMNILIAILNTTYGDLEEQAVGVWALQFTDLLHRCENLMWPPPFNFIAFSYYSLSLKKCPNVLRSHIMGRDDTPATLQLTPPSPGKTLDTYDIAKDLNEMKIWRVTVPLQKPAAETSAKHTQFYDSLYLQNPTGRIIDIHVLHGDSSYFLFSLLPKSFFRIPRIGHEVKFEAHQHVFPPDDDTTIFYDNSRNKIPSKSKWNLQDTDRIGFKVPKLHKHPLIYYHVAFEREAFLCDFCVRKPDVYGFFMCSETICRQKGDEEDPDRPNCDFGICTNCYYNFFLESNLQKIDADLNLFIEGERWWLEKTGDLVFKVTQNPLIQDIARKYLESNPSGSLPLPEPWNNYAEIKDVFDEQPEQVVDDEFLRSLSDQDPDTQQPPSFSLPVLEPSFDSLSLSSSTQIENDDDDVVLDGNDRDSVPLLPTGEVGESYVLLQDQE